MPILLPPETVSMHCTSGRKISHDCRKPLLDSARPEHVPPPEIAYIGGDMSHSPTSTPAASDNLKFEHCEDCANLVSHSKALAFLAVNWSPHAMQLDDRLELRSRLEARYARNEVFHTHPMPSIALRCLPCRPMPRLGCMRYRTPGFRQLVVRRPRWSYLSPLHDGRCLQGPKTRDTVTEAECVVGRRICWWAGHGRTDGTLTSGVAWKLERIRGRTALEHQRTEPCELGVQEALRSPLAAVGGLIQRR